MDYAMKHRAAAIQMWQHWIVAPNGSPSLCWWSWEAMDELLGCDSKRLAEDFGLIQAVPVIVKCERKDGKLFLEQTENGDIKAKTYELPGNTYDRTMKLKEEE